MVSMFNPRLTDTLTDFPFARLNALIASITPPAHLSMINLAVGGPQGAMPAFARDGHAHSSFLSAQSPSPPRSGGEGGGHCEAMGG
jgi:hypothetical protein